jgi:hypothetical protein
MKCHTEESRPAEDLLRRAKIVHRTEADLQVKSELIAELEILRIRMVRCLIMLEPKDIEYALSKRRAQLIRMVRRCRTAKPRVSTYTSSA